MGVIYKKDIIERLNDKYPEFTRASIKELVDFGIRKTIHHLNNGNEVLLNGHTKDEYDGVFFCEDVSFSNYIKKLKVSKLKMLNRIRVQRFKERKQNAKEELRK